MDPVLLPPPYGGMNDRVPRVAIQFPQCESLLNFNPTAGGVELRNGDLASVVAVNTGNANATFNRITFFNGSFYVVGVNTATFTVYAATPGGTLTSVYTDAVATISTPLNFVVFNSYLFVITHTKIYYFDGTTWGIAGYTPSTAIVGGGVYKNRIYFVKEDSQAYYYSSISAISGALSEVSLAGYTESKSDLVLIAPVSIADVVQGVDLLAFVFDSGEVLYYSGSYPDSSDWQIVGRGRISAPISYNSLVTYQGDKIVMCQSGIYSLKELFLKSNKKGESLLYNENINAEWTSDIYAEEGGGPGHDVYNNSINNLVSAVWDPAGSRIIFLIRLSDYAATPDLFYCKYFIYHTDLDAWYTHKSLLSNGATGLSFCDICIYQSAISQNVGVLMKDATFIDIANKEGRDYFYDLNGYTYDYEIISAPIANGRAYITKAAGMDVIQETDINEWTSYQLIKDLGVDETAAQSLPTAPTGLQKPFINMGIEGSYIQYKISGTTAYDVTKTVGLTIYGTNIWLDNGKSPR